MIRVLTSLIFSVNDIAHAHKNANTIQVMITFFVLISSNLNLPTKIGLTKKLLSRKAVIDPKAWPMLIIP